MRRWVAVLTALTITIAGVTMVVWASPSPAVAAAPGAGAPFDCSGDYVYSFDYQTGQNIYSVPTAGIGAGPTVTTTVVSSALVNSSARNALAITPGGTVAYYIATVGGTTSIYKYDPVAATSTVLAASPIAPPQGGAYDPANGYYYFGNTAAGAALHAFNPATNTVIGQVGTLPANATSPSGGGDFAFDNAGDFFWTNGPNLYNLPATAVPSTAGTGALPSATLVSASTLGNEPGIAFDPAGHLYEVTQGGVYNEVNPITGATSSSSQGSNGTNIADMAGCDPPSSLTVRTNVTDRTNPGDQFTLRIAPAGGTTASVTTTGTTAGLQTASVATVGVVNLSYTVSEVAAATTNLANYVTSYTCIDANNPTVDLGLSGTGTSVTLSYPGGNDRRIVCTFTNTPTTATLALTKSLAAVRSSVGDQFTVAVRAGSPTGAVLNSTTSSTTSGSGANVDPGTGTTGATTVVATRTYYLTEAMAAGSTSTRAQYTGTITCTDSTGRQTGLPTAAPFTGSVAITPVADAAIACSLSNATIAPTLTLAATLTSPRYNNSDQFAVAIHTDSATGPVVSSPTNATTAGTGATVTPGTGTTGTYSATTATSYYLTETATGNASRYSTLITCVDANRYQSGLPTNAPFTGALQLTPVSGAAITCTLSNAAGPAVLSLAKSNPANLTVGVPSDYTLTVTNDGGQAATAHVVDVLPPNLQYVSTTGTGWSCTPSGTVATGQRLTCTGPSIAPAGTSSFAVRVTPTAAASGSTAINRAAVDPSGGSSPVDPSTCTATGTPAGCAITPAVTVDNGVSLQLTKANPTNLTVGVPANYTLTVANTGAGPAASATVADLLPAGLSYNSASGATCTPAGQLITCTVPGPIAATTGTASFTINVTPTPGLASRSVINKAILDTSGGNGPGDPSTCTGGGGPAGCAITTAVTVGDGVALSLRKTNPASLTVGEASDYTLTVTNAGTGPAASATVVDVLPAGLSYNSANGAACTAVGQVVTCTVPGPIAATIGTVTFTIKVTPLAAVAGRDVVNRAAVDPSGGSSPADPSTCTTTGTPAGCAVTAAVTVGNGVVLSLSKTNPTSLTVGVASDYTLTVTNTGTGPASTATVADLLPAGLSYNSASGAACTAVGQLITCTVPGPIAATTGTATFTINVTPLQAAAGLSLTNAAVVDSAGGNNPGDPSSCTGDGTPTAGCATTPALTVADGVALVLTKTNPASLTVGVATDYTLTVTNNGTGSAATATVTDALPDGLAYNSATGADCTIAGRALTCTVTGPIAAAGGTRLFTVNVTPLAVADGRSLVNRASIDPSGSNNPIDPNSCQDTGTPAGCAVTDPITVTTAQLHLVKTATPVAPATAPVALGDRIRYDLTVTNASQVTVIDVQVADPKAGTVTCAADTLLAGASTTCTAGLYSVTQADLDAGQVENTATATATLTACNTDCELSAPSATARTATDSLGAVAAVKTAALADSNHDDEANAGETIVYTVGVTNTGTVTLDNVTVADPLVSVTCPSLTLAVGASMNCTGSYQVTAADEAAGHITNTAIARAKTPLGQSVISAQAAVDTQAGTADAASAYLAATGTSAGQLLLDGALLLFAGLIMVAGLWLFLAARRRGRNSAGE